MIVAFSLVTLCIVGTLAAVVWYGVPLLARSRQVARLEVGCRERGLVLLTYDDGPSEALTPRLLDLLDELDAKATFFVTGAAARSRPETIESLRSRGHEVGSHSERHVNAFRSLPWRSAADCREGLRTLVDLGAVPKHYRPPYGNATLGTLLACRRRGARAVWWTHDSGDTGGVPGRASTVLTGLLARLGGRGRRAFAGDLDLLRERLEPAARGPLLAEIAGRGGVILLHDSDRGLPELDEYTLRVTREIVEAARGAGLRIATLDEVLSD